MTDMDTIFQSIARHRAALADASKVNKETIFGVLAASGFTRINVTFDGEGDSGQIENILAYKGETQAPISDQTVTLQSVAWDGKDLTPKSLPLQEALEQLCYDYLEQKHGGWENNDGAFGEFILDVAGKTVELEFNGRYSDVHTSTYTF